MATAALLAQPPAIWPSVLVCPGMGVICACCGRVVSHMTKPTFVRKFREHWKDHHSEWAEPHYSVSGSLWQNSVAAMEALATMWAPLTDSELAAELYKYHDTPKLFSKCTICDILVHNIENHKGGNHRRHCTPPEGSGLGLMSLP